MLLSPLCVRQHHRDPSGSGTLATLLLRQLRSHLPPCRPQIGSSGASLPELLYCIHSKGSHMSLAQFPGGKCLPLSHSCPFPLAEFGTCLPIKYKAMEKKKPIPPSEEGNQIDPPGPLSPSNWIHYWPKNADGETLSGLGWKLEFYALHASAQTGGYF